MNPGIQYFTQYHSSSLVGLCICVILILKLGCVNSLDSSCKGILCFVETTKPDGSDRLLNCVPPNQAERHKIVADIKLKCVAFFNKVSISTESEKRVIVDALAPDTILRVINQQPQKITYFALSYIIVRSINRSDFQGAILSQVILWNPIESFPMDTFVDASKGPAFRLALYCEEKNSKQLFPVLLLSSRDFMVILSHCPTQLICKRFKCDASGNSNPHYALYPNWNATSNTLIAKYMVYAFNCFQETTCSKYSLTSNVMTIPTKTVKVQYSTTLTTRSTTARRSFPTTPSMTSFTRPITSNTPPVTSVPTTSSTRGKSTTPTLTSTTQSISSSRVLTTMTSRAPSTSTVPATPKKYFPSEGLPTHFPWTKGPIKLHLTTPRVPVKEIASYPPSIIKTHEFLWSDSVFKLVISFTFINFALLVLVIIIVLYFYWKVTKKKHTTLIDPVQMKLLNHVQP